MKNVSIGLVFGFASAVFASADTIAPTDLKGAMVRYAQSTELKVFPAPSTVFERGGLVSKKEKARLLNALIIPIVRSSIKPVSVVVVEVFTSDPSEIRLTVYLSDGTSQDHILKTTDGRPVDYSTYQAALKDFEESARCDD